MQNKKLFIFNLIIFLLLLVVIFIGSSTWKSTIPVVENEITDDKLLKRERPNPMIRSIKYTKKKESDVQLFVGEELEIIELEEAIDMVEEIPQELNQSESSQGVNQSGQHSTSNTPSNEVDNTVQSDDENDSVNGEGKTNPSDRVDTEENEEDEKDENDAKSEDDSSERDPNDNVENESDLSEGEN